MPGTGGCPGVAPGVCAGGSPVSGACGSSKLSKSLAIPACVTPPVLSCELLVGVFCFTSFSKMAQKKREKRIVGWKEHVALPDLKVKSVIAKIDTGASVASIDASEIKIVKRQGVKYVSFKVMKRNNTVRKTSAPLAGYKRIKSSNGDVERRPYVKTTLLMDGISKKIELTLTDRGPMDYTMLIGKKALGRRWLVNPAISYLTTPKKEDKK